MKILFSALPGICGGKLLHLTSDRTIEVLLLDSRKQIISEGAVFFAIKGDRHDGHQYINFLYEKGIRQFIIEQEVNTGELPEASILQVESSIDALQKLAAFRRSQFHLPVIGITGSNAKTILKEWLFQLTSQDLRVVKNPGSYNSQTGVPLSVWQMNENHELGIFEAGISRRNEMKNLQAIIQPTIGIFTNIGSAHDEGFASAREKMEEKSQLFEDAGIVIYNKGQRLADEVLTGRLAPDKLLSWGGPDAAVVIRQEKNSAFPKAKSVIRIHWETRGIDFNTGLPFSDAASTETVSHAIVVLLWMGYSPETIQERIHHLRTIPMRLELKQGINGCQIIDDSYNNDLAGLQISLEFLKGIQQKKSVVVLSDILQSGLSPDVVAGEIISLLNTAGVSSFVAIGPMLYQSRELIRQSIPATFFVSTEAFMASANFSMYRDSVILVKGARPFRFERIVQRLQKKIHGTVMEIDLGAMVHNLNFFRSRLSPNVKLMAMVKAFAYGSGSEEVANLLQYHGIDYLGVAYADEGVELRKNNIRLPVMVMNPSEESFGSLLENDLEPELYSLPLLRSFAAFLNGREHKIHLKFDTGMHRLGFESEDFVELITVLKENTNLRIASVFSHLSGADEQEHDEFTHKQVRQFLATAAELKRILGVDPVIHILNSSGILRFPQYQFGMVRLGIGLYGIDPTSGSNHLLPVATLKTVISQIRKVAAGESIGYGRRGRAEAEMVLATLAIGYADGYNRAFSRGVGEVLVRGKLAPVVGNVCMDMTMIDVTDTGAEEGEEVVVYGKGLPIGSLAKKINTIPYEILTSTSERVKRVFFAESI